MSNINKYIVLFGSEFKLFIEFLDEVETTNGTQKILSNITHINLIKIAKYIYNKTINIKTQLFKHSDEIFINSFTPIPEINLSNYYYKFNDDNKNKFWGIIVKIHIYSSIITESLNPELKNSTDEILKPFKNINKIEIPSVDLNKVRDEDISVQASNSSLHNLIEKQKEETENNNGELNGMFDMIGNLLNTSDVGDKLKNIKDEDLNNISSSVNKLFGENVNPEVSNLVNGMVQGIGKELKNTDITKGNVFENIVGMANKMSEKYIKDEKTLPPMEELARSTQNIMNGMNMNGSINPETITQMMKQMGINKNISQSDIEGAMKHMGMTQEQLTNPNRKLKRMMNKK
jgi:hypothetical protein